MVCYFEKGDVRDMGYIHSAEEWLGSDNTLGLDIWKNKYQQNDETFDEWLDRVSGGYAGVRSLIEQKKFLFAGRTLAYRGLEGNTAYSNCYVGGGHLDDSMEAIMDEAKTMTEVMKRGGGYGFALDKLRPKGAVVNNGAKYTGGIVPFMKMYSEITNAIAQGGSRKGALMLCLADSHPDIFEFIHSKEDLTSIDKANISVKISDKFMDAVMKDEDWTTRFEVKATGEVIEKTFRAKDLWYDICYGSYDIGDPAIMFWDNVQYHSYLSEYVKDGDYEFVSSNPCLNKNFPLLTTEGYKKIGDLCDTYPTIINKDGIKSESHVWCSGEKETIRLNLSTKKNHKQDYIECTPDHRFMTTDRETVEAKDLLGKRLMPMTKTCYGFDDYFVMLGFIQGDGCLTGSKRICIGKDDEDVKFLFDMYNSIGETQKNKPYRYAVIGEMKQLWDEYLLPQTVYNKTLPECYWDMDFNQKRSFLRGLYSANGSVCKSNGKITYTTVSKELAQNLLKTLKDDFGIDAYLCTAKEYIRYGEKYNEPDYLCKEQYHVNIGNFLDKTTFLSLIGFVQYYKVDKLIDWLMAHSPKVTSIKDAGIQKVYDFTEPHKHWGVGHGVIVHNCAEYTSGSWGTCNLGSMNLSEYVLYNGCIPYFNWDDFEADIKTCVYALNDVIDENRERLPFVQQREYLDKYRPIGLGVMGYADCLIKLGFTYGSEDALNFTETLAHTLAFEALKASEAYAKERNCNFIEFCRNSIAKSPICKKIGYFPDYMANAQILSIAPTGTLATMLNVSGGIEPNFAFSYNRRTIGLHDKEVTYKVYAKIAEDYMKATGITNEESLPEFFIASQDIPWKERVKTQGIWQSYVDNAISSTVNLPNEATVEDIMGIYETAWQYGLKGITVFRDGCRRLGILTTDKSENVEEENILSDKNVEENDILPRGFVEQTSDDVLVLRRKLKTGCGNMYVLASWSWDDGTLKEVFVSKGSSGSCASNLNGLSRLASMSARAGVSLEDIVDQLQSVQVCPSYATAKATKEGISKGHSCPSAIGYALLDMKKQVDKILFAHPMDEDDIQSIKEYEKVKPKETKKPKCPNCGEDLIMEMGCVTCRSCGYSRCG